MFVYEKKLQFPVKIANPNPKYAQIIISQYGGPDGEMGASMRYLSQRFSVSNPRVAGLLTDIGVSVAVLRILGIMVRAKISINHVWELAHKRITSSERISV